jgi:hypothetical protein
VVVGVRQDCMDVGDSVGEGRDAFFVCVCAWALMHCATPCASDVCMIKSYEHMTHFSDVSHWLGSVHGLATLRAPTARTQQTAGEGRDAQGEAYGRS